VGGNKARVVGPSSELSKLLTGKWLGTGGCNEKFTSEPSEFWL
jgi:hypothetical protein